MSYRQTLVLCSSFGAVDSGGHDQGGQTERSRAPAALNASSTVGPSGLLLRVGTIGGLSVRLALGQFEVVCNMKIQYLQILSKQHILCLIRGYAGFILLALKELSVHFNRQQYNTQKG